MEEGVTSELSDPPEKPTCKEVFEGMCPVYMSYGMSPSEYWDGEADLVKWYREAYKLSMRQKNQELWLQGRYIYDAICAVSPILHAFAKKGTRPSPYHDEPYNIFGDDSEDSPNRPEPPSIMDKGVAMLTRLGIKKLEEGGGNG